MADQITPLIHLKKEDGVLGLYQTPERDFWIRRSAGSRNAGGEALGYLIAERRWAEAIDPNVAVHPGDIVIDCGANVGMFVHFALKHGASKVIAIDPEKDGLECLRRNFETEIAASRVVVVPLAVWNSKTELRFNTDTASAVYSGSTYTAVPADTLDAIVASLDLPRVDFIKMDIEGAEREALAGARQILAKFRPRIYLDAYHLPDDSIVLPAAVRSGNPAYQLDCGSCFPSTEHGRQMIPYMMYFHP